jgi:hypothetical protein
MRVESYSFGRIVVGGETYTKDVIIYPDRVLSPWWRNEGHLLQPADLEDVVRFGPAVLIVGTGASGVMRVRAETVRFLEEKGITVYVERTDEAVERFNRAAGDKAVVAALHLTC